MMLRLLRQRDFGLLFGGALISQAGDFVLMVALPFWIYRLTGSAAATGGMFAALTLPQLLLSPIAGVFVDRWHRKWTMIAADLVRAAIMCGFFLVRSADQAWLIYLLGFCESVASRFFFPARGAVVPLIAGRDRLAEANAALGMSESVARLGGPALGGVLVVLWGPHGAAAFDGISYVISAAAISCVRIPPLERLSAVAKGRTAAVIAVWRELLEGVRVVASRPALRTVVAVMAVFMLSQGIINVLLVVMVTALWHGGSAEFGWLISAQGIGSVLAAPLVGVAARRFGPRALVAGGGTICGVMVFVVVNQSSIYPAIVPIAAAGMAITFLFVGAQTISQLGSDNEHRGRVMSLQMTVMAASSLVSTGITSAVLGAVGTRPMLDLAGLAIFTSGLIALLGPRIEAEPAAERQPEVVAAPS